MLHSPLCSFLPHQIMSKEAIIDSYSIASSYAYTYRIDRISKKKININGVTIPKGAVIIIPSAMIHQSPRYWRDPEILFASDM